MAITVSGKANLDRTQDQRRRSWPILARNSARSDRIATRGLEENCANGRSRRILAETDREFQLSPELAISEISVDDSQSQDYASSVVRLTSTVLLLSVPFSAAKIPQDDLKGVRMRPALNGLRSRDALR